MIFLNLNKAYDALERSRCLEILEGYGVGTHACRLLQTYWSRLKMWQGREGITRRHSRVLRKRRDTCFPPPNSMWWWIRWCVTARRRDSVRGGIQETDDGIGTCVPGEVEGKGPVQVVRGGYGT